MHPTWIGLLLFSLLGFAAGPSFVPTQQEFPLIHNFFRLGKDSCSGGQPRPEQSAQLKAAGVKAIRNLRPAAEHGVELEETAAKENGLRYINIPLVFPDPKDKEVAEFLKITDKLNNRLAFIARERFGGGVF